MEFITQNLHFIAAALISGGMLLWPVFNRKMAGATVGTLAATQMLNKGAVVVDVRESAERQSGYIPDSKHVPLGDLANRLGELDKFKSKPVIVCCASGARSGRAASTLRKAGFTEVYNLDGGMGAWRNAGLPLKK